MRTRRRLFLSVLIIVMLLVTAAGCTPAAEPAPDPGEEEIEVIPGIPPDLLAAVRAEGSKLNVYNWSYYIDPGRVEQFEELFGIEVTYDLFESNPEMKAKIMAGGSGYDVIYPSQNYVTEMRELGLLQPLNHDWIPNMKNLMDIWKDPSYDPGSKYSAGYMWGTTGYVYNIKRTEGDPRVGSWALMLEGEEYAGRMTMLEEYTSPTFAALKYLGYSLNTEDTDELMEARELVLAQKPLVAAYMSGPVREQLIAGDIWIAQFWSGDSLMVMEENSDYNYVVPEEGGALWIDAMCIPKDAPHPAAAHLWINYMLEPEVQAAIVEYVWFPSAVEGAKDYLDPEILNHPAVYPDEETLARCEISIAFTGEARRIREQIWEELKY